MDAVAPQWCVISHPRYRYELTQTYHHVMRNLPMEFYGSVAIPGDWAKLYSDGVLQIKAGYCWDGASGPAIDTMSFCRAALVHDVLYQLIAAGKLRRDPWKRIADAELRRLCLEDGMPWWRASYVWLAVRVGGHAQEEYRP